MDDRLSCRNTDARKQRDLGWVITNSCLVRAARRHVRKHANVGRKTGERMKQHLVPWFYAAAGLMALPAVAFAQSQAYTNSSVNVRAGPARDYPIVTQLPGGYPVTVMGCISSYHWCDVAAPNLRGWVYAGRLSYPYQGSNVPVMSYGTVIGLPIVTFSIGTYWGNYYRGRPWYSQQSRWAHHRPPPPPKPGAGRPPGGRPPGGPPPGNAGGRPPGGKPPGNAGGRPPAVRAWVVSVHREVRRRVTRAAGHQAASSRVMQAGVPRAASKAVAVHREVSKAAGIIALRAVEADPREAETAGMAEAWLRHGGPVHPAHPFASARGVQTRRADRAPRPSPLCTAIKMRRTRVNPGAPRTLTCRCGVRGRTNDLRSDIR